jgi:hypothetical protein
MAFCRDRLTKELQSKKYNVVRLPRSGIEPLDVYGIEGKRREPLGRVEDLWSTALSQKHIEITTGIVSDLSVTETDSMRLSLAFEFLAEAFRGFGWNVPKVHTAYQNAHRLKILFNKPTFRRASVLQLGKYLNMGDLQVRSPVVQKYFFSGSADAIILTEVLQAMSITVEAEGTKGSELDLNVGLLEGMSNGSLSAKADQSRLGAVTYTGSIPVTFAFKAIRLLIQAGAWTVEGVDPDTDLGPTGTFDELPPLDPDGLADLG